MAAKTNPVVKAVLCRTTNLPIALVKLPSSIRTVRIAGAHTADGKAVNVSEHKVTANKRFTETNNPFRELPDATYHEQSDTYQI